MHSETEIWRKERERVAQRYGTNNPWRQAQDVQEVVPRTWLSIVELVLAGVLLIGVVLWGMKAAGMGL
jgi:hypothetical protein